MKDTCPYCMQEIDISPDVVQKIQQETLNMQKRVNESLDSATGNDYVLDDFTTKEIAIDLATYDVKFEGVDVDTITPFIQAWKNHQIK